MAVRISSSKFLESTLVKTTVLKHIDDPIFVGGGPLPDNIKSGVAKLIEVWFDVDEQGRESFRARGEVVLPDVHCGQYIKGRPTKQWVPYSSDTLENDVIRIQRTLVALGGKNILGDGRNVNFFKIAEFLTAATKNKPIYFGFGTSPKKSEGLPKVNPDTGELMPVWPWENWYAAIPGFREPIQSLDQKKTEPSVSGSGIQEIKYTQGGTTTTYDVNSVNTPAPWTEQPTTVTPTQPDLYTDTDDLSSIITRAVTNKDSSAMDKLDGWAKELGYTQEDLDDAPDYRVIGGWVISGNRKEEDKPTDLGTPVVTTKPKREVSEGQVYTYSPPNKREGGPRLKERECRVVSVDNLREVAKIQNLAKKDEVYEVDWKDEFLI